MRENFQSAPVPIRLTCRYSNGSVVSYGARALGYDDSSIQVLSSEIFARGISLNVLAPFWKGMVPCRVAASSRNQQQPAYFELDLKFVSKLASLEQAEARPLGNADREPARKPLPREAVLAAQELAVKLEATPGRKFSDVLQETAPSRRLLSLLVTVAGVLAVLHEKGVVDVRHLLGAIKGKV